MALFHKTSFDPETDRRSVRRWVVDCEAALKMLGGDRLGRLSDLSETGARLELDQPPAQGASGLLVWSDQEHFCKIIWVKQTSCGVLFERQIARSVVEATAKAVDVPTGPVADFSNIPLGQKRSRRASLVSSAQGSAYRKPDADRTSRILEIFR
ncbi:PilZ domain-containing protein [Qipengyuania marisflavi]|uniref:PilZ domain-containing protein n=1 Tax=Qipengyuania marisflavi TaxID=2486356 RepID=UPI001486AB2E|nr:PilZ domain-containing protein [Qipengyuania marisflavi]